MSIVGVLVKLPPAVILLWNYPWLMDTHIKINILVDVKWLFSWYFSWLNGKLWYGIFMFFI